jgi:hypothetical protein
MCGQDELQEEAADDVAVRWGGGGGAVSYDAAGADDGSVQRARFAEEDPSGDEGGVSVGVGSPSRAREGKRVGGSGHPGQGGYFCGEEEDEEEEEEVRHSMRAGAEDAGCPKEETWHKSKL